MKKLIINEDWETIEVEDTSSFFVLIFKQGTAVAGYIKTYSVDDTAVLAEYESLISQYEGVKFVDPASIIVIKVPATDQVKMMLEEAEYTGDETNQENIEIINHLLGRADCEVIKEKVLMSLEEAKKRKKKKKKKSPTVTYTMGFPYLNDHRFNHACGSCDCGKDAAEDTNDSMGSGDASGESSGDGAFGGDAGSSEGGAMGEALVTEAMTPLQKMQALEAGTRGFNAAAASDQKLLDNYKICMSNGLGKALKVVVTEISYRVNAGTWTLGPLPNITPPQAAKQPTNQPKSKIDLATFDFYDIGKHYLDYIDALVLKAYIDEGDMKPFIKVLEDPTNSTPEIKLSYSFAMLLFALYFKHDDAIQAIRDSIMRVFGYSAQELKQYIKAKLLSNSTVTAAVQQAVKEALREQVNTSNNKLLILETFSRLEAFRAVDSNPIDFENEDILVLAKRGICGTYADMVFNAQEATAIKELLAQLDKNIHWSNFSNEQAFGYLIAFLLIAMDLNLFETATAIKNHINRHCGVSTEEIKSYIKNKALADSDIINSLNAMSQRIKAKYESIATEEQNMNLTEAKRYIKRYYIRPQNVFASNKAEILQRLAEVEADNANCSVYSLKALEDHDDVHLLQPKDIIYYYDEGVLYDKNHVPVLDYDLNVKNEEERPKISPDATSDERFKDVYQDRMTDRTVAESLDDFYMDFDDVNAFGIKLHEGKETEYTCCICGEDCEGYGNNPAPYKESGKCCDACNRKFVIPARLMQLQDED